MIIGLTGAYCAGKNFIGSMLEARGLPVLDVDKLGYQALEAEKEKIFNIFGSDIKRDDGSLDRRLLGRRVFGNPEKLAALEAIVHPAANLMTNEWIKNRTEKNYVINAALLHRCHVFDKLDRIILVTSPFFTRMLRARKRDRLSWAEIIKRFSSQKGFKVNYLLKKAEIYRIGNPGISSDVSQKKKLEKQIDCIIEGI